RLRRDLSRKQAGEVFEFAAARIAHELPALLIDPLAANQMLRRGRTHVFAYFPASLFQRLPLSFRPLTQSCERHMALLAQALLY
ncbi:hypothetical protein, partial [Bradyrhizobium genosp. SA-3]|uniref:hypothetical protein n=1 Tax=Bradyrhizobium genosp. SA-3 TaxID=508868 RepID=UPI0013EE9DF2